MRNLEKSILKTLCYSDIFDYPLTKEEIWHFLINDTKTVVLKMQFEKALQKMRGFVSVSNNFYYLKGRRKLIKIRIEREKESKKKIKIAKKAIRFVSILPFVLLVGVSGSLSMNNAQKEDDIDLFIVCKKNTIWITRFIVVMLLQFLGMRRKRNEIDPKDKICLNMIITEDNLRMLNRNLYIAHEIAQLLLLFERDNMYGKFIASNKWVLQYLPNVFKITEAYGKKLPHEHHHIFVFERFARKLQLLYMNKHITSEKISDAILAFHPHDNEKWILQEYKKRIKVYV